MVHRRYKISIDHQHNIRWKKRQSEPKYTYVPRYCWKNSIWKKNSAGSPGPQRRQAYRQFLYGESSEKDRKDEKKNARGEKKGKIEFGSMGMIDRGRGSWQHRRELFAAIQRYGDPYVYTLCAIPSEHATWNDVAFAPVEKKTRKKILDCWSGAVRGNPLTCSFPRTSHTNKELKKNFHEPSSERPTKTCSLALVSLAGP